MKMGFSPKWKCTLFGQAIGPCFWQLNKALRNVLGPNRFKHGKLKLRAGIIIRSFAIARKEAPCVQILTEPARHYLQMFPLITFESMNPWLFFFFERENFNLWRHDSYLSSYQDTNWFHEFLTVSLTSTPRLCAIYQPATANQKNQ